MDKDTEPFRFAPSFYALEDSGSFTPGDFQAEYEALVADALRGDGQIDEQERKELDLAARALGLPKERVAQMEEAIRRSYERRATFTLLDPYEIAAPPPAALDDRTTPATLPPVAPATLPPLADTTPPSEEITDDRPTPQAIPAVAESIPPRSEEDELHDRFEEKGAEGALDEQFCTAAVLIRRGDATPHERELHDVYRSGTLPRPMRPLTFAAWTTLLFHPLQDRTTGDIFAVIASAVLRARVAAMHRGGALVHLDPRQRHDPDTSTVSAVRAVGWCANALGLRAPAIYVDPDRPTGLEIVTALPPAIRIGRAMLTGKSALELAFQCARTMTWFREEYFICTLLPEISFLEDVFLAALLVGAPDLNLPRDVLVRALANRDAILPALDAPRVDRLRELAHRFIAAGGRTSLRDWAQAAEFTACRAGLLMCGDLAVASGALAREPGGDERARELEGFWASDAASELRRDLGVAFS